MCWGGGWGGHSHAIHTVCGRHDKVPGHQGATTEVASLPLQRHHERPCMGPGLPATHNLRGQRGTWGHVEVGVVSAMEESHPLGQSALELPPGTHGSWLFTCQMRKQRCREGRGTCHCPLQGHS